MKTLMILIFASFITFNVMAQDHPAAKENVTTKSLYCAVLMDGKLKVMNEGKEVLADITLLSGTKITSDATVVNKDGTRRALTNGECVDSDGNILMPGEKSKVKKEK